MSSTTTAPAPAASEPPAAEVMTHRQVLEALSGLLLGMFVTLLSSTVVSTSLPQIIHDLGGGQSAYTWVVTATLLTMTISTPIWGKLADLFSRKLLVQIALVVFVVASAIAGLAQDPGMLIGCRALQGIGAGGMMSLAQIVIADIISPRNRGRYMGLLGGVMAVAQVGGPLLGGVLTDTLSWHYNFYVGIPFAIVALILLQLTLHLPRVRREVRIDYAGAALMAAGVGSLLIWVSLAGEEFDWASWWTVGLVSGGTLALIVAVIVEAKAAEPLIPLRLFKIRTVVLAVIASVAVGTVMIGTSVFLSQYMQIARGKTPTETGLLIIPMVAGVMLAAMGVGQIITRTGRWKWWIVLGTLLLTTGLSLMSTIDYQTSYVRIGGFLFLVGLGVGMCMQNLVLAVQNSLPLADMGAGSALVAFFRTLGGAVGVALLGALLSSRTSDMIADGLAKLGVPSGQMEESGAGGVPDVSTLPGPIRQIVEQAYGDGVADLFLAVIPVAVVGVIAALAIREVPLGTKSGIEQTMETNDLTEPSQVGSTGTVADGGTTESQEREPVLVGASGAPEPRENDPTAVERTESVAGGSASTHAAASNGSGDLDASGQDRSTVGVPPAHRAGGSGEGPSVYGVVRRSDGGPLAGVMLSVIDRGGHQVGRAATPEDGRFRVEVPAPGGYLVIASRESFQPQAATVVVGGRGTPLDIALGGVAGLRGVVLLDRDGSPIGDATVALADHRGEIVASQQTARDGSYRFSDLAVATYTLAVSAGEYQPVAMTVRVDGTDEVVQNVELAGNATLRGTTWASRNDRPVPDARVSLIDTDGEVVAVTDTDEAGGYAFGNVPAGDYTVVATGYPPTSVRLSVSAGENLEQDVELGHPET